MKDPENKKSLNETEEKAVSGGLTDESSFLSKKEYTSGRISIYNQGEPVPPYNPQEEPRDGGATGSW